MSPSQPTIEAQDYEEHADWLRSLARSLVSDPAAAEDLAQETWLSALRHGPDRSAPLRPWLTRVVQNAARKLYRSEGRRKDRERLAAPAEEPLMSAAELSESADLIHTLMGEVRELSEPYRSTVLQAYLQGMSAAEIAQQTGAPEGTVRWRLSVARDELRERMDRKVGSRDGWAILVTPMGFAARLAATKTVATTVAQSGAGLSWALGFVALACLVGVYGTLQAIPSVETAPSMTLSNVDPIAAAADASAGPARGKQERIALGSPAPLASSPAPAATAWTLDPGQASLHVRVEDASGAALQGVNFLWPGNPNVRSATNKHGAATLLFRPPASGAGVEFLVERSGYVALAYVARPVAGEATYLGTVRLEKAVERRGSVLRSDGAPTGRVSIFAAPASSSEQANPDAMRRRTAPPTWEGVRLESVETGRDGSFVLRGLPREPMRLWAKSKGPWYSSSNLLLPDSEEAVEIVLEPLSTAEAIAGTVLGIDGQPAADVLIRLRPLAAGAAAPLRAQSFELVTNADGRFRFQPSALGSFEILGEDLLDRWADTQWQLVEKGEASIALRFTSEL